MKLPDSFLGELRARTPLPALIGRRVKLSRSGRNWKGCCPFHGEKTPSFYAYDDHYHCFGCGAHGDAIGFVMQAQGASFMEAVESLASEAGLDVPKPSREAAEAERQRLDLHDILAKAAAFYQAQLFGPGGAAALEYLRRRRGLSDETIRRFGLGWAGGARGAVERHFTDEPTGTARLIEAGLLRPGDDGAPCGDFFYNRVMFPIRDRSGRVISFGGRTMGDGQPKYLNGPETGIFSKRLALYGLDFAKTAARHDPIIVVEGYLDVIMLHQSGFPGAVAPLGTALTAEQLAELWRLSPEPVICFDGDAAGARAADRAAEICLPLVSPDRSVKFASLASGEDPDSIIRDPKRGPAAFRAVVSSARPLSTALYDGKRAIIGLETPERRARLLRVLSDMVASVADTTLRSQYNRAFKSRVFEEQRRLEDNKRARSPRGINRQPPAPAFSRLLPDASARAIRRLEVLLSIVCAFPAMAPRVADALERLAMPADLAALRTALLAWLDSASVLDSAALTDHLHRLDLRSELDRVLGELPAHTTAERAQADWWHFYALTNSEDLEQQVALAERALAADGTEASFKRHDALVKALWQLKRGGHGWDDEVVQD